MMQITAQNFQNWKSFIDHFPDFVALYDRNYKHLYVNHAIERANQLKARQLLGKSNRDLSIPADTQALEDLEKAIDCVFRTQQPVDHYTQHLFPDGWRYFHMKFSPQFNSSGQVESVWAITREITPLRRAQELLKQSQQFIEEKNEELERANDGLLDTNQELLIARETLQSVNEQLIKSNEHLVRRNVDLDHFVFKASHDLKAPLNNLEGLLNIFLKKTAKLGQVDPELTVISQMMQDALKRFQQTLVELAQTAKEQHNPDELPTGTDLTAVVEEVQLDLQPVITEEDARIENRVRGCNNVHFSRPNLKSVVYNLFSNAIKYRSPERPPRIELSCQEQGEYILFTVQDNGLGIAQEDISKLFVRYQRLHDHVEGTGVGLYLVKKMVENEGGWVEVESSPGQGSRFRVYLKQLR